MSTFLNTTFKSVFWVRTRSGRRGTHGAEVVDPAIQFDRARRRVGRQAVTTP